MTTMFLAVIALSGPLAPAAKPEFQAQTDYGHAMKVAASEKKPMAVLIGTGDAFAKIMSDASLAPEAKKLLSEKYVCVSVDTGTMAGKELAGQFEMANGGLVISSAGGTHQALRQLGAVTAADLSKYAPTYAKATGVPATTVTAGVPVAAPTTSFNYPATGGCPGGNCPNSIIPAGYAYPSTPFYGSSCPTGRCPNATPFAR